MSNPATESFSFVNSFAPMVPRLDRSLFSRVASQLQFTYETADAYYVQMPPGYYQQLVETAGLPWADFIQSSAYPSLRLVTKDLELLQMLGCGIYPVTNAAEYSRRYSIELIPNIGRVFMKYQTILGSRLLFDLEEDDVSALEADLVAKLQAFSKTEDFEKMTTRARAVRQRIAERQATEQPASRPAQKASPEPRLKRELAMLRPEENFLVLPSTHLLEYDAIKRLLETAGGRYARGVPGFEFAPEVNARNVLEKLLAGETVNPKKVYQFFASTPAVVSAIADLLPASLAGAQALEPSAGDGALADLLKSLGATVKTVEIWDQNVRKLQDKGYQPVARDFLELTPADLGLFDVIVANPPFTKGQDVQHIQHMLRFLKPHGSLHCVMSQSWQKASTQKAKEFRKLLETANAQLVELPPGTFQDSGTSVGAVLVSLRAENLQSVHPLPLAA